MFSSVIYFYINNKAYLLNMETSVLYIFFTTVCIWTLKMYKMKEFLTLNTTVASDFTRFIDKRIPRLLK